jgi:bis(5'-nucleosyl)-tetraphosphatase (symmetrical)
VATYTIGDVQGCHDELVALLDELRFDPARDRLRFVGDLVNRGPASLAVLRLVHGLRECAESVLGNHDLHLLAAAHGLRKPAKSDTLSSVLEAPDCDELLAWLRRRPLLIEDPITGSVVVHAGLPPHWDLPTAHACARELENTLSGDGLAQFLAHMYGDEPRRWHPELTGFDRLRYITNAFTRMRYCNRHGDLDFSDSRPPGRQAEGLTPWFAVPGRRSQGTPIVFGHWATLQLLQPLDPSHGVVHLDSGCVWGGALSARREEDGRLFSVRGWQREGDQLRRK